MVFHKENNINLFPLLYAYIILNGIHKNNSHLGIWKIQANWYRYRKPG